MIALVGNRDPNKEKLKDSTEKEVKRLKSEGKILEDKGAPFGLLFSRLDAIVCHGGLGTTAEALRAGVPTMVTGVLLMDQRRHGEALPLLRRALKLTRIRARVAKIITESLKSSGAG